MSTHKNIDKICCVILAVTLIITILFMNGKSFGIEILERSLGYEEKLFDISTVHTINIVMDNFDKFIEECEDEEYVNCSVVIDNESIKNVAIRAKGNTSLSQVKSSDSQRYSFKIEFDHYDSTKTYHGLDKLSLNNIIQDNTYMKDFIVYQMMNKFDVSSPLCSFVNITVNGENWGLYLAVEGVEDSFLQRNYGSDSGVLYKPDSMQNGGGRGNGEEFDMDKRMEDINSDGSSETSTQSDESTTKEQFDFSKKVEKSGGEMPEDFDGEMPEDFDFSQVGNSASDSENSKKPNMSFGGGSKGGDDVSLIYSDDEFDSYSNIFDNAKTDISDKDKTRLINSLKNLNNCEELENTVDIEKVIRYFVVHNFVCNFDSYTGTMIHNYYLYEKDGQMQMIPWDYNLAFGGFMGAQNATTLVNYPIDSPVSSGDVSSRPMISWIFSNEEYTELYHQYFEEFLSEFFDSEYLTNLIDTTKQLISSYVENDPTKFCTFEEFEKGVETLREFCVLRAESINLQLDGTISSTSDGQKEQTNLVDASSITISDMGSMGNMGGGFGKNKQASQSSNTVAKSEEKVASTKEETTTQKTEETTKSENNNQNSSQTPPNMPGGNGERPEMPEGGFGDMSQMPDGEAPQMPNGEMPQMPDGEAPQMPGGFSQNEESNTEEQTTSNEDVTNGEQKQETNNSEQKEVQQEEQKETKQQTTVSYSMIILLAASILVLIVGIIIASKYKRRG